MCEDCKELKKERDDLLEALSVVDGRAEEIFSEYFANKAMVKHLRKERDELAEKVILLEEQIFSGDDFLEETAQAEKAIQDSYTEALDRERAASIRYLKGFCMVCEDRKPCNCERENKMLPRNIALVQNKINDIEKYVSNPIRGAKEHRPDLHDVSVLFHLVERYRAALFEIADYGHGESMSGMDEPGAAETARKALENTRGLHLSR